MILRDRLQILDEVLKSAKEMLAQHSAFSNVATRALARAETLVENSSDPKEILDTFRRIHDMQMQSLQFFNAVIEKFPVEHTIQELQLLEIFRNLTERQKQTFMHTLEATVRQK